MNSLNIMRNLEDLKSIVNIMSSLKDMEEMMKKKRHRSCSVRKINRDRNRNGFFKVTFLQIKELDSDQFFVYTRMNSDLYKILLDMLKPLLIKTSIRESISPECGLAVCLQYLSQGTSIQSLAWSFKMGKETVRQIVLETSDMIWKALFPIYVSEPTLEDTKQICFDFWNLWNLPNCIGAIDGKHIAIRCPPSTGSQYFNYKKHFSIVLMAVCDANYKFIYVDVGAYGSQSDGGIFQASSFGKRLLEKTLPIPHPKALPNTNEIVPHYFVADAAFPLTPNIMKPYPGTLLSKEKEHFNKRLSRARRTIENSFGILVSRWRILLSTLHLLPENAEKITLACVALHNFILACKRNATTYCPINYVDWDDTDGQQHDGLWHSETGNIIPSIAPSTSKHQYGGNASTLMRNTLCEFLKVKP